MNSIILSKHPISIFGKPKQPNVNYEEFVSLVESIIKEYEKSNIKIIWIENTIEGQKRIADISPNDSFYEQIKFSHNKRQVMIGYNQNSGKSLFQINYTKNGYLQIDIEAPVINELVDIVKRMIDKFETKLFLGGDKEIGISYITQKIVDKYKLI